MIPSVVTTAPGIFILPPIDNNFALASDLSVTGATAVVMRRGVVGKPFTVTKADWEALCGRPLPMSYGVEAEGMRHVVDALDECARIQVMRVIADDAKFPVLRLKPLADESKSDETIVVEKDALPYGEEVTLQGDEFMVFYPVDGDPSTARKVVISPLDNTKERFRVQFREKIAGTYQTMAGETYIASLDEEAKDDLGRTAYLPAVLEEQNSKFRALVALDTPFKQLAELDDEFEGGTNGKKPSNQDFKKAWDVFRNPELMPDLMFAAGMYDADILAEAIEIAEGKLAQFRFDAPPQMTEAAALEWLQETNLNSYQIQCYHYPYKASDQWFGGKAVWGVSGSATSSKALCLNSPTGHLGVRGAHLTNAGERRGLINRRGVEPLHHTGKVDPVELVSARLNPVHNGTVIGDCLTVWNQENYQRFEHIGAILNDISHEFLKAAQIAKFEPDGLTLELLTELCDEICQARVQAGALVTPRDPQDGEEPYQIHIEQVELDLWSVTIAICPTGVARRIAMQPIVIK